MAALARYPLRTPIHSQECNPNAAPPTRCSLNNRTPPKQLCAAPGYVHVFRRRSLRCIQSHTGRPGCLLKQNPLGWTWLPCSEELQQLSMHPWLPAVPALLSTYSLGLHRHAALPPARLLPLARTAGGLLAAPGWCSLLRKFKQNTPPEAILPRTKRLPGLLMDTKEKMPAVLYSRKFIMCAATHSYSTRCAKQTLEPFA